jgi:hypothetical protein
MVMYVPWAIPMAHSTVRTLELSDQELTRRVPLYAISSLIAIFSLEAAFFIDAVRDLYEVRFCLDFARRC